MLFTYIACYDINIPVSEPNLKIIFVLFFIFSREDSKRKNRVIFMFFLVGKGEGKHLRILPWYGGNIRSQHDKWCERLPSSIIFSWVLFYFVVYREKFSFFLGEEDLQYFLESTSTSFSLQYCLRGCW